MNIQFDMRGMWFQAFDTTRLVPEPATLAVLVGLLAFGLHRHRTA
ncbi:MAG: PEP-CTERM sorting domain-containing protein [Phycisphaeraceae bacterium]|nr:PEP-CTERM sorting domain-containing protein [Phycisphaeraceae bacterium]